MYCTPKCKRLAQPMCSVDGCEMRRMAQGICQSHYNKKNYPDRDRYEKVVEMPCASCGATVIKTKRSDRQNQFCSLVCRGNFQFKAVRDRKLPVHVVHPNHCAVPAAHWSRTFVKPKPRVFVSGPCAWCGELFTLVDQTQARHCSDRCAARHASSRYRTRRGKFAPSPTLRREIYERDGFVCQLCFDPVDMSLPYADLWSATLDHIECRSWALIPDDSPSNLRLAHRWCNSVRGDESYYTTDVLSA